MRILHLTQHLSKGGAERQLSYLAPALAYMGHEVSIAYVTVGAIKPKLKDVTIHHLDAKNYYDPFLLWKLLRLIHRLKPDIIQTWILQMDIFGGVAATLSRIPWVLREPNQTLAYPSTWKNNLRVKVGTFANSIVSNSVGGDEYWANWLPNGKRHIISNGLPLDEIDNCSRISLSELPKTDIPIVLYVARLDLYKQPREFLEAIAYIRQKQEVLGIVCGDGPLRSELEALRHRLGLTDCVYFTGYLPADSVWALMKNASVFVSLSLVEGRPNTVMEAMVCGCPLVLSDIPAHREILDNHSANFVNPIHIQQIADTIIETLNVQNSAKDRALCAKQKTQEWSIEEMAKNYEKVYKDVLSAPFLFQDSKRI